MQLPLVISYRGVEKTDAVENLIRQKASRLDRFCDHITSCRVSVEKRQVHQRRGNPYRVRINMTVPPKHDLVAEYGDTQGDIHTSLEQVIRETFDAAGRQLSKLTDKQNREVKVHEEPQVTAVVSRIFPERDYGFLRTVDDREVYFHRNAVSREEFDKLGVGMGVRYEETLGNDGPQASMVQIAAGRPRTS